MPFALDRVRRALRWFALAVVFKSFLLVAPAVHAGSDFSTGVSDDRLSLPEGPGSLEGVGDNVDVDPNMALMKWRVPIELPRGFAGATPSLGLSYSSGAGQSVVGIGWSLAAPSIERMTARGLPEYDSQDLIAANGGEELVRVSPGWAPVLGGTIYRARFESSFVRYLWLDDASSGSAGHWEAQYPDGSVGYFGADASGAPVAAAREEGRGGTFRYLLVEKRDVFGHAIRYSYTRDPGGRALLDGIAWVFDDQGNARYHVSLLYEDRPDFISDASSGVELKITQRVASIEVYSGSERIRRYVLSYDPENAADGRSRLVRVETRGLDDSVYPITHKFSYQNALGASCTVADCGQPFLVDMGSIGVSLASGKATLIDINGDALPDVIDTSQPGAHRIFINQMAADGSQSFAAPVPSALGTSTGHTLGTAFVQVLDANGDGFSDLLNALTGEVLINKGGGDWDSKVSLGASNGFPTSLGQDAELRFLDYDDDKRIDVVHSDAQNTLIYRNLGDQGFAEDPSVETLGAGFASDNVQFADMNGDGLLDAVRVRQGEVSFRINLGWGHWSSDGTGGWRAITGLPISSSEVDLAMLEDLNGDALADLIVVTGAQVKYALNRNGVAYDAVQTVSSAAGGSLPERTQSTVVLAADLNGNGSTDIVWIDDTGGVTFLDLFPVRPHLLSKIENGIGRVSEVHYSSSVLEAARDAEAGDPWAYKLPFPMTVVTSVDEYDLLTNLHDVTTYSYHDGFYDGVEKQYRGYEDVEITVPGGDGDATGFIVSSYDIGVADPYRAGLKLHQSTESDGTLVREQTFVFGDASDCPVAEVPTPTELEALGRKPVRSTCKLSELTYYIEGLSQDQWVTTESRYEYDGYGNVTLEADLGVTAIGAGGCEPCEGLGGHACGAQCLGDESYQATEYVTPDHTGGRWILGRPFRSRRYRDPASDRIAETLTYYDGDDFVGLALGQLGQGLVSRVTQRMNTAGDTITTQRSRYNADGEVVEIIDPNGSLGEVEDHRRMYSYDDDGLRVTQIDILLKDDTGAPYRLRREVAYDLTFSKPIESSFWMRVVEGAVVSPRNSTYYAYDVFGRLVARAEPGDTLSAPSEAYSYNLASPVSQVVTRKRSQPGQPYDVEVAECYDGRGRQVQTRGKIAEGAYLVSGFKVRNLKGELHREYQSYEGVSAACDTSAPDGVEFKSYNYDALDRLIHVTYSDADQYGQDSVRTIIHAPLMVTVLDEEASDSASVNHGTALVQHFSGLGKIIQVDRQASAGGEVETVRIAYDELGSIAGYIDAAGNRKTQTYDLAGRLVRVQDPNAGTLQFQRDARGNITRVTDARGRVTVATYDGNNRLLERYEQGDRDGTLVRAYYDVHPSCEASTCTNLAGRIAGFVYPKGEDRFGYDARNNRVYQSRTLDGHLYEQRTDFDGSGRRTRVTYPDGRAIDFGYDGQSRLASVSGVVDAIGYEARGGMQDVQYRNGLRSHLSYDSRGDVSGFELSDAANQVLLGASFQRNRLGQLIRSEDQAQPADQNASLDASWMYDARHRLVRAELDSGRDTENILDFSYDATDNLIRAVSSLGDSGAGHVGSLAYDGAQPNAVTGAGVLAFGYDASGNMVQRNGQELSWDFMGRLEAVVQGGEVLARFDYGATRERVRRDEQGQLTHYINPEFIVRDGVASITPILDGLRLAELDDASLQTELYSDLAPQGAPDQQINAGDAWLAVADEHSIIDVSGTVSPSENLLAAAARRLLHEGGSATRILHHDVSGSVVMTSDAQGHELGRRYFTPYGTPRFARGDLGHFGYAGQERDASTGLLHFANRLYDPHLGRWVSADPAFVVFDENAASPGLFEDSLTAYAYVGNDPMGSFDPDGAARTGVRNRVLSGAGKKIMGGIRAARAAVVRATGLRAMVIKHPKAMAALKIATGLTAAGLGIAATIATFGLATPLMVGLTVAAISLTVINTSINIVRTVDSAKTLSRLNNKTQQTQADIQLYEMAIDHIGGGIITDVISGLLSVYNIGAASKSIEAGRAIYSTVLRVGAHLKSDQGLYSHYKLNKAAH